jgi:hypothetical protein
MASALGVFLMYRQNSLRRIKVGPAAGHQPVLIQLRAHCAIEQNSIFIL